MICLFLFAHRLFTQTPLECDGLDEWQMTTAGFMMNYYIEDDPAGIKVRFTIPEVTEFEYVQNLVSTLSLNYSVNNDVFNRSVVFTVVTDCFDPDSEIFVLSSVVAASALSITFTSLEGEVVFPVEKCKIVQDDSFGITLTSPSAFTGAYNCPFLIYYEGILSNTPGLFAFSVPINSSAIQSPILATYSFYNTFYADTPMTYNNDLPILESQIWSCSKTINGNINIAPGKTLTITPGTVITFGNKPGSLCSSTAPGYGINIAPGGKLILDGCTLKATTGGFWKGIQVLGSGTISQPVNITQTTSLPDHGYVKVKNNATIRDACCAICVQNIWDPAMPSTTQGGGIVQATGTPLQAGIQTNFNGVFTNNAVGILFSGQLYQNRSIIDACKFENSAVFPAAYPLTSTFVQILADRVTMENPLLKNKFINSHTGARKGLRILSTNSTIKLGSTISADMIQADNTMGNTFTDLAKGIQASATKGMYASTDVYGNTFQNVRWGVTLTGNFGSEIVDNIFSLKVASGEFNNSPVQPINPAFNSYAVHSTACEAIMINGNQISTQTQNYTTSLYYKFYGIITRSSSSIGATNTVRDNDFSGHFQAATQYENGNNLMLMNCNEYMSGTIVRDWSVTSGSLNDQGSCGDPNNSIPLTPCLELWHTTTAACTPPIGQFSNAHIFKASAVPTFTVTGMTGFPMPVCNSSGVSIFSCANNGFISSCQWRTRKSLSELDGGLVQEQTASIRKEFITERTKRSMQSRDYEGAKTALLGLDDEIAKRIMVPTYITENKLSEALTMLNSLDMSDPENQNFYATYNALIEMEIEGDGKAAAATEYMHQLKEDNRNSDCGLAESRLIRQDWNLWTRVPEDEEGKMDWDTLISFSQEIRILPNPAKDYFAITGLAELPISVSILDLAGTEIKVYDINAISANLYDLSDLPKGLLLVKTRMKGESYRVQKIYKN